MIQIELKKIPWSFQNGIITISETDVRFATRYNVISPNTGVGKEFEFTHATGPEFDKNTQWIYKSEDGIQLAVCNDEQMAMGAAEAYLKAKLRKV